MKKNHKILLTVLIAGAAIYGISVLMKKDKAKKAAAAAAAAATVTKGATDPSTATPGIVAKQSIMNENGVTTAKDITG